MRFIVYLSPTSDPSRSTALSLGLELKGRCVSDASVTVVSVTDVPDVLSSCISFGADDAYMLSDPAFKDSDAHGVARILQAFVDKVSPDGFVLMFQWEDDSVSAVIPAGLSGLLGSEEFYYVTDIGFNGSDLVCTQDYGDASRRCRVPDKSVVLLDDRFQRPPLASVGEPGEVKVMDRVALCLGMYSVGSAGARVHPVEEVL